MYILVQSIYHTHKFPFSVSLPPPTVHINLIKPVQQWHFLFLAPWSILTQRHVDEWLHSVDNPPVWGRVGGWGPGFSLRLSLSHHWSLHGMSTVTTAAMRNRITCQTQIIAWDKDYHLLTFLKWVIKLLTFALLRCTNKLEKICLRRSIHWG